MIALLTTILTLYLWGFTSIDVGACFQPKVAMEICMRQGNFRDKDLSTRGYDFGFGSVSELEDMCSRMFGCRTHWHTKTLKCLQKISQDNCSISENSFQKILWRFSLESKRYERAARYICRDYNLQVFRNHIKCFQDHEERAEVCSMARKNATNMSYRFLQHYNDSTGRQPYHQSFQAVLAKYECIGLTNKIRCLTRLLSPTCSQNAVELIQNYFRETLPPNCHYSEQMGTTTRTPSRWQQQRRQQQIDQRKKSNFLKQVGYDQTGPNSGAISQNHSVMAAALLPVLLIQQLGLWTR